MLARTQTLPLVLLTVLATGCGSTVQNAGSLSGGAAAGTSGAGGDSLGGAAVPDTPGSGSAGNSGSAGGFGGTSGSTGTTGSGSLGSGTGGATGTSGGTTGGTLPTGTIANGPRNGASGPGVTASTVYVGLIYDKNAGAVNQAAGIGSITTGNTKANEKAIIDDINKHGGVGGRKLEPVYANFDTTSTQTLDQQFAAVCARFTTDSPRVFAVAAPGVASYRKCLAKADVSILSNGLPIVGAAEFQRYPGFIEQGYPNLDRLAAYEITPLVEQKYFTPWDTINGKPAVTGAVKVGVLTYDDDVFGPAVDNYLVPALKKLGYDPVVQKIKQVTTAGDYGAQGAAVKSAQLTFASRGVTHVIPFEGNGGLSTLFLPNARSQKYYPRYGVNSASGFEALIEAGITEPQQMNGALGYGWIPGVDLPRARNPQTGPYSNAARRQCLQVLKDQGITFDSGNAELVALGTCASLYLLKTTLDRTPKQITQATLIREIESLGSSYLNPGGIGQEFRPGRHDPSNRSYYWNYYGDCNCFHYSGTLHMIP